MSRLAITILALAVVASTACTHRHQVRLDPEGFSGRWVTVHTHRGEALLVQARPDIHGAAWYTKSGRRIPASEVRQVRTVRRGRGLLQGFGIGALTGAGIGAVYGFAHGDDPECSDGAWFCLRFSAEEKAAFGAAGFGLIGAGVGAIVGLIAGSADVYERPRVSVEPAAGGASTALSWSF